MRSERNVVENVTSYEGILEIASGPSDWNNGRSVRRWRKNGRR